MPHLLRPNDDRSWTEQPLTQLRYEIDSNGVPVDASASCASALLVGDRDSTLPTWFLIVSADTAARVNGELVRTGIKHISNRDLVQVRGGRAFYFSTEERAKVVVFTAGERPTVCPRCRKEVETGQAAVRCPTCRNVHHEMPGPTAKNCWTYAPTCSVCSHITDLTVDTRWTPEVL